jgi:hypothetical protein
VLCAFSELQWSAPELLRAMNPVENRRISTLSAGGATMQRKDRPPKATPEADVYAVAVILKEVFARNGPYTEYEEMTARGNNTMFTFFIHKQVKFLR